MMITPKIARNAGQEQVNEGPVVFLVMFLPLTEGSAAYLTTLEAAR
jgi:hypothetical protein